MTKLMTEALKKISELPVEQQDALAAVLLEELEDDERWSEAFEKNRPALESLAGEALEAWGRDFGKDESPLKTGTVLKGRVVGRAGDDFVIDVGLKSEVE